MSRPIDKNIVTLHTFAPPISTYGTNQIITILRNYTKPATLKGLRWDFMLSDANMYDGLTLPYEMATWIIAKNRSQIEAPRLYQFINTNDNTDLVANPEDVISAGFLKVYYQHNPLTSAMYGPDQFNVTGGGGELIDGSGVISDVAGQIANPDLADVGLFFPYAGGVTTDRNRGKADTARIMQPGDQLVFQVRWTNVTQDLSSAALLRGLIQWFDYS